MARKLGRLLMLCGLVGVVSGIGAIAFVWALELTKHYALGVLAGFSPAIPSGELQLFPEPATPFRRWLLFFIPALGGILSGLIVYLFAPEAEGHGTDAAINSYHFKRGEVRARIPVIKAVASAITIGTGGSGGREGPIAQIGAGFGSILANLLRLSAYERRILLASGMAAGIGAVFHAPLAGALFAAEVLYREMDMEYEVIVPAIISSVISYAVFASVFGWDPLFESRHFLFRNPAELVPYFFLALVLAGGAVIFIRTFYGVRDVFRSLKLPNYLKPAIGGLVVGVIGFFLPAALGTGYGIVDGAFAGQFGLTLLLVLAAGKILTTSFSIGSGGSGGVFGPSVVIGGALGGAVGIAMQRIFPGMSIDPGAFVMVGMAGFFAAAANTPISTVIMVSEMTGNYNLLVPSMWVCIIAYLLVRRSTIYERQLPTRMDSPSHMGEMMGGILKRLTVADALANGAQKPFVMVNETATLRELLDKFAGTKQACFPVLDRHGNLAGMVDGRDLRQAIREAGFIDQLVIAKELAVNPPKVTPQENLYSAVHKMVTSQSDEVIVVDEENPQKVIGILSRTDLVAAYDRQFLSATPV
ncbi:MAG: chloride channel protein [Candidatus Abyssobacteria bacterium SURF_5]|uniref:Chloride channel protein n=1 Tax=Abyssobacteria bacterium (strain SURF_5) TaxID=2093360 RepID=A0A3A4NK24_ABYX5|nr:MAG: chloride channel protein [Candidatus Abyssubacteria bacterium SURF_5]